jgi:hypothetical protein
MWPDFRARAYWNGYLWEHRTDQFGFRNPVGLRDRSLVWLGDSMIYGHGVAEEDTAVHRLRTEHGLGAYNAARQGDCLYQEYLVSRLLLAKFHPRTLVLTIFLNDFEDLEFYRSAEEIAAPPELALDVPALDARLEHPQGRSSWSKQRYRLKLWRLARMVRKRSGGHPVAAVPPEGELPSFLRAIVDDAHWTPIARYYERVLSDLSQRAREHGAELVLLHLDVGDHVVAGAIPAQNRVRELLDAIGRDQSIRVLGSRSAFDGCDGCFLPNDGHLSPEGHRRLASFLASGLDSEPVSF